MRWDHAISDGTALVVNVEVVVITKGANAGTLYRFKGAVDPSVLVQADHPATLDSLQTDLSTQDFSDSTRWEKVKSTAYRLFKGDTVRVAQGHDGGGESGRIYRYIGTNNQLFTADEDYSDTERWQIQEATLSVSVLEAGQRWKLVDAAGQSYTLSLNQPPEGSNASTTVVLSRNSINALSVAASAAVGLGGGGAGLAFSGAGAVALNTVTGATEAPRLPPCRLPWGRAPAVAWGRPSVSRWRATSSASLVWA